MSILLPDAVQACGQLLQGSVPASCHQDGNLDGLQKAFLQAALQCCLAATKALPLLTEQ